MDTNRINANNSFLKYIPFIIFFIIIFLWHFTLPRVGDDLAFGNQHYMYHIFSFLANRYETWTSRLLIEFFLVPLAVLPKIIWNFLDSIIFLLMAILIPKIWDTGKVDEKKSFVFNSLSCILVLIYIFTTSIALSSAGYIATTLNYTWPLVFGLLHFYLVKKYVFTENKSSTIKKIFINLIMILALIFATNQEVMLMVVSGGYFFIISYCLYNKINIPRSIFFILFIIILQYLNVYLCPGNNLRYSKMILYWFPDYNTLSLVNKIDLGISVLFNRILLSHSIINLIFFGIMGIYVYSITKKKTALFICLMPIIIIITLKLMILMGYMPIVDFIKVGVTRYGLLHSSINHILINSGIYAVILFSVVYSLIQIHRHGEKNLSLIIFGLLILGFGSQMMKGFSPTCWASVERWEIYYYFSIILITYIFTVKLLNKRWNIIKQV